MGFPINAELIKSALAGVEAGNKALEGITSSQIKGHITNINSFASNLNYKDVVTGLGDNPKAPEMLFYEMAKGHCFGKAIRQAKQDGMPVDIGCLEIVAANNPNLEPKQAITEAMFLEAEGLSTVSNNKGAGKVKGPDGISV